MASTCAVGSESYHHVPRKMWERLWYQFDNILILARKIDAINRFNGDPYGSRTAGVGPCPAHPVAGTRLVIAAFPNREDRDATAPLLVMLPNTGQLDASTIAAHL